MNLNYFDIAIAVGLALIIAAFLFLRKHPDSPSVKLEAESLRGWMRAEFARLEELVHKPSPAAPAASIAAGLPPAAAAPSPSVGEPSAGSGGTAQIVQLVTAADAVTAKHAQLDRVIADAQAAIADAQTQKAAINDAQAALAKAVA